MHGNARLTPVGRLTMVHADRGRAPGRACGGGDGDLAADRLQVVAPLAGRRRRGARSIAPAGPRSCPHQTPPRLEAADRRAAPASSSSARPGSGPASACRLDRAPGAGPARAEPARLDRPAHRPSDPPHPHRPRPASWSTSTSRSSGRIPDGGGWRTRGRGTRTTAPRAPQRRLRLRPLRRRRPHPPRLQRGPRRRDRPRPAPRSGRGPTRSSPATASPSKPSSPTTAGLPQPRLQPPRSTASSTAAPGPTDPRPTAKSNASTAPCSTNGPTSGPTTQKPNALAALDDWLHLYNHHRHHTAIGGPPISRVNDLPGHYS